jgi:peptide/nickel transport system permease protein
VKFLLQRIAFYLFTAWAAITINFFIPRLIPGDPVTSLINKFQGQMSTEAIHSLYVLFGLDKNASMWSQYVDYWGQIFHGNLGLSFTFFPTPVSEILKQSLPWTIARRTGRLAARFLAGRFVARDNLPVLDPLLLAGPARDHRAGRDERSLPVLRWLRAGSGAVLEQ